MQVSEAVTEAANTVAESLDAMVFVYSGSIDYKGYGSLVKTIDLSNKESPRRPNAVLFLTTLGGDAKTAYRIARFLQEITDKFYLCVPSMCKSAGTLIALGASEIYMPLVSELGPLDVQLRRRDEIGQQQSGMVVRTALAGLASETKSVFELVMIGITLGSRKSISFDVASRVASKIATGVMAPVYAQIDPESLGNNLRDLAVAKEYGHRLVEHGGNATEETVRQLVEDYPAHDFIIDGVEAKKIFATVKEPTEEMDNLTSALGEIVYIEQSPQVILRLDKHPKNGDDKNATGTEQDDGRDTGRSETSIVDQGRKATGGSDRKAE